MRYDRQPSNEFLSLFADGGPLFGLLEHRAKARTDGAPLPIDFHFRENNCASIYFGLTQLVKISYSSGKVKVSADKCYENQARHLPLFREWKLNERGLPDLVGQYLANVDVSPHLVEHEGRVQAAWSQVSYPWVPIDREAVIGYESVASRDKWRAQAAREVAKARLGVSRMTDDDAARWRALPPEGKTPGELDQLAVDDEGRLVLLELKNAAKPGCESDPSKIFYAPLQLLQYIHEWAIAYSNQMVRKNLAKLIEARRSIGLSVGAKALTGNQLRPVIAFGEDDRSAEAKRRLTKVVEVINAGFLPKNCLPIEVWMLRDGLPTPIRS